MAKPLEQLEKELAECLAEDNHLEALDIYEEIQAAGALKPDHMVGMGNCLMGVRRRQDAKKAWLKAFEADQNFQPAIKALNDNFPGWRKELPKAAPPPRPAAATLAPQLTGARPQPSASAPGPKPLEDSQVNWEFVMADAAETRLHTKSAA